MKNSVLIFMLLLVVCAKTAAGYSAQANDELIKIAAIVTENNLSVEKWQVTIKERISRDEANSIIKQLKNSYFGTTSEDENIIKYSFSDVQKTNSIVESYKVIKPKNDKYNATVISVIQGDDWNQSIKEEYQTAMLSLPSFLFTKDADKFACLTTDKSDTMSGDNFFDKLTRILDIQHISTQYDSVEKSNHGKMYYGYTPLWNQKFMINGNPMNVHMAINKGENGMEQFTIGTPILINEY